MLHNELESPARVAVVRNQFGVGSTIEYFNGAANRVMSGVVEQKTATNVILKNIENDERWKILYYRINTICQIKPY